MKEGDFVYLKRPGCSAQEGRIISEGDPFTVRLEHNGEVVEARRSEIWTTFDTPRVIA